MKELTLQQMESIKAGEFVAGLCIGIGAGSAVYAIGTITNWWNPVGWVSAAFVVADVACLAYAASNLN